MSIEQQNQDFIYKQLLKWKEIAKTQQIIINLLLNETTKRDKIQSI